MRIEGKDRIAHLKHILLIAQIILSNIHGGKKKPTS